MWCLETIVALNDKLAEGKSHDEAYNELGIKMPKREPFKPVQAKPVVCEVKRPLVKAAS